MTSEGAEGLVPKEVFARRASGLVREASLIDAFSFGFLNQGPAIAIWDLLSWGIWLFPSGDVISSIWLATLFAVFGGALVWGILGASMPRSGGSYVYNTRILHPAIGMAVSFADYFAWWLWGVILAPWVANPGLTTLFSMLEMPEAAEWCASPLGLFIIATLVNFLSYLFTFYGLKRYLWHQRTMMVLSIFSLSVVGIVLGMHSHEEFVAAWNAMAAQYGSLDYESMIQAAMEADPRVFAPAAGVLWGTMGLVVVNAWWARYGLDLNVMAGEIKRPQRNIMIAQVSSVVAPAVFVLIFATLFPSVVGRDFMYALAVADNVGLEGYNMPFPPNFMGVTRVFLDITNPLGYTLALIAALSFIICDYMYIPLGYVAASRIAVAWGMDRMGPRWFSEVNPRWASPVKNLTFFFIACELGIALYCFGGAGPISSLDCPATEGMSLWGVTALGALIFPFVRKVRSIWETSPYRNWRIGSIHIISIAAIVDLINVAIIEYFYYTTPELEGISIEGLIAFIFVWTGGMLWWAYWRWRNKKEGIDIDLAWKELPPE
ncbi:MAG: APC family permease [Candidatus Korarchaeum sp.]